MDLVVRIYYSCIFVVENNIYVLRKPWFLAMIYKAEKLWMTAWNIGNQICYHLEHLGLKCIEGCKEERMKSFRRIHTEPKIGINKKSGSDSLLLLVVLKAL